MARSGRKWDVLVGFRVERVVGRDRADVNVLVVRFRGIDQRREDVIVRHRRVGVLLVATGRPSSFAAPVATTISPISMSVWSAPVVPTRMTVSTPTACISSMAMVADDSRFRSNRWSAASPRTPR
ncbi:hypothetical protein BG842_26795 [Haladaptatus sp. W1]|nr:hypothetical protein BG842_26795 [Haladaptatus sp. W1]